MASPELTQPQDRWLRAFGYGLLAEIATIITIIAIVMGYRYGVARGLSDAQYAEFASRVGTNVGVVGGTLYVFLFSWALMPRIFSRFVAHGLVVAVAAIALSVGGSIAGHQGVPSAYVLASALKLFAGGLAGTLGSSRAHRAS